MNSPPVPSSLQVPQATAPRLIEAMAFDYDGTLATRGRVAEETVAALERARASGLTLLMVTGRELPQLTEVFSRLDLFAVVVAENGALMHDPATGEARALGPPPPTAFVEALKRRGVSPLSLGRCIVATLRRREADVRAALAETGVDWRLILNNESLMCLPPGVDKRSGLLAALARLGLPPERVLGVGDAENDAAFLAACGLSAAVANALPELKRACDLVAGGEEGDGVVWLIERLLSGRLAGREDVQHARP
ncbi:MAG: HAD family hydrolase [Caulobacteraceae bacterium]